MRSAIRWACLILAGVALTPPRLAAESTNALDGLKAKLEVLRGGIESEAQKQQTGAASNYVDSLTAVMQSLKQKGDLDSYLTVQKERTRFCVENSIPADSHALPALVVSAAEQYRRAVGGAATARDRRLSELLKQYDAAVDKCIKQLMLSDNIADAKRAKEEKNRIALMIENLQPPAPPPVPDTPAVEPAPVTPPPPEPGIEIEALVEGVTELHVTREGFFWRRMTFRRLEATYIDGKTWFPDWDGHDSSVFAYHVPSVNLSLKLVHAGRTRGGTEVDNPSSVSLTRGTDDAIITFNELAMGARWYTIRLTPLSAEGVGGVTASAATNAAAGAGRTRKLTILKATWNIPGESAKDLTQVLQDRVVDGQLVIDDVSVLDRPFHDHYYYSSYVSDRDRNKKLVVSYRDTFGRQKSVTKKWGERLELP